MGSHGPLSAVPIVTPGRGAGPVSLAGERVVNAGVLSTDDLAPDMGDVEVATFPDLVAADQDETVIFAFVVYESREHRDEVNAAVHEEMEAMEGVDEMPFDVARMVFGGFEALVEYQAEPSHEEPIETTG